MVTARQITGLLEKKHAADFFASQVKNGPTLFGKELLILDGWAMKKSWANPLTIGYEIKVSRGDFLQDSKWHNYLDYCNEFYFAAPPGIIRTDELPPEAGLILCSANLKMMLIKKRAIRRQVEIPDSFFRYVLMNKIMLLDDSRSANIEFWEKWLKTKEITQNLGYAVSKSLRQVIDKEIFKQKRENEKLADRIGRLEQVQAFCERNGIDYQWYNWKDDIHAKINGADKELIREMGDMIERMQKVYDLIKLKDA